jgi:type II secretory pathway pseudopilin PulG
MRDLLVRYLLGELDDREQRDLEQQLRSSPELRQELAYLQRCFSAADDARQDAPQPPPGLAARVTGRVCGDDIVAAAGAGNEDSRYAMRPAAATVDPPAGVLGWSLADLTVAAGVVLAVGMLMFPAMQESRDSARRRDCQHNLGQLGTLLATYAEDHGRYLPQVGPQDNAGIFAVRLVDGGYINSDELGRLLVCRASPMANDVAAKRVVIRIPNLAQLRTVGQRQLPEVRRLMGGTYAYRIGYVQGNRYYGIRHTGDGLSPLAADAPTFDTSGVKIANHGGYGQNVLYQDQSVRYQHNWTIPGRNDHLFLNAVGVPAAGRGARDAVLGRSEATPGFVPASFPSPAARRPESSPSPAGRGSG